MRHFTKYPSSYIKASKDINYIETEILKVLNDEVRHPLTKKDFVNLTYFMSGYMHDITLREYIDALENLTGNKGLKLKGLTED